MENKFKHTVLIAAILKSCREHGESPAFSCQGKSLSFEQLEKLSCALASYFRFDLGLQAGARVAVCVSNLLQYPLVALAVLRAGLVLVNVNSQAQLRHSEPELLLVSGCVWRRHIRHKHVTLRQALKQGGQLLQQSSAQEALSKIEQKIAADSPALLQFTNDGSGCYRAVMLSHGNLAANVEQMVRRFDDGQFSQAEQVMLASLPLPHVCAFTFNFAYGSCTGRHTVLIPDDKERGRKKQVIKALRRWRPDIIIGTDNLYRALLSCRGFSRLDFRQLRICSSFSRLDANTESPLAEDWYHATGCRIMPGYALTETASLVACNSAGFYRQGTVGRPLDFTEIRIVDAWGKDQPPGVAGNLLVRGPQLMQGYWRQPRATARAFVEQGWLRTNEMASVDEDGYLQIIDCRDDVIDVSGCNVYPAELERYICRHPDVQDAAVLAVRGEPDGVSLKLLLVCPGRRPSAAEIKLFCRQGPAAYKIPQSIEYRDSLPRSTQGKLLRDKLQESSCSGIREPLNNYAEEYARDRDGTGSEQVSEPAPVW